jgi:hypothetical protein
MGGGKPKLLVVQSSDMGKYVIIDLPPKWMMRTEKDLKVLAKFQYQTNKLHYLLVHFHLMPETVQLMCPLSSHI